MRAGAYELGDRGREERSGSMHAAASNNSRILKSIPPYPQLRLPASGDMGRYSTTRPPPNTAPRNTLAASAASESTLKISASILPPSSDGPATTTTQSLRAMGAEVLGNTGGGGGGGVLRSEKKGRPLVGSRWCERRECQRCLEGDPHGWKRGWGRDRGYKAGDDRGIRTIELWAGRMTDTGDESSSRRSWEPLSPAAM